MRRFQVLQVTETFVAQAAAIAAFIMVAAVVLGLDRPARAAQRLAPEAVRTFICAAASCKAPGF